jgi:hypothetical protein
MKYLILASFLMGCITSEKSTETTEKESDIQIRYRTNTIDLNVTFCRPDGNIEAIFGTVGFDTTMYFRPGSKVCLYADKRSSRISQSVIVEVIQDSSRLLWDKGDEKAAVSGYVGGVE